MTDVDDFLEHYGVQGMRWGVRRAARKDAVESSRAKMYYGEGAGTRRKLIKAKVESRSKDERYKKEFDAHLAKQDMGKRAAEAKSKRRRTDTVKSTKKTARGLTHVLAGNPMYASAAAIAIGGGAKLFWDHGGQQVMKSAYSAAKTSVRAMQIKQQFKKNGW